MSKSRKLLFQTDGQDNPYVIGLDISLTSTGVYMLSLNPTEDFPDMHYRISTTTKDGLDSTRLDFIASVIIEDMQHPQYPVIAACIEDYGPSGRIAGKVLVRAELCGIIKHRIRNEVRVPYITVSPNGLKKEATGHGGTKKGESSKDSMLRAALAKGFDTKSNDEADAYHAALLCEKFVRGERITASYQRVNPEGFKYPEIALSNA